MGRTVFPLGKTASLVHYLKCQSHQRVTMTKTTVFADRLQNISIQGNLVRMELAVIGIPSKKDAPTPVETTHQLVMPLEGFAQAVKMQANIFNQLSSRTKAAAENSAKEQEKAAVKTEAAKTEAKTGK